MEYPGIDGFLPWRASLMLDVVFLAMFAVIPVMAVSVHLVKHHGKFALHKQIQVTLGIVLQVTVAAFEADMQFISGWRPRAIASPYYAEGWTEGWVHRCLYIHLVFAVSTAVLWVYVIWQALRKFPNPPAPCEYSPTHKRWARLAAADMTMTALTGWTFYYLAFVA